MFEGGDGWSWGKEDDTHTRFDGVEVEFEGGGAWDRGLSVIDCFSVSLSLSLLFVDTDGLAARPVCVVAAWGVGIS